MSAQALASQCVELGMPWLRRQAIANLENGRRDAVAVDELFVLALALGVAPFSLLIPDDSRPLAITPQVEMSAPALLEWLGGTGCPTCHGRPPEGFTCGKCGMGATARAAHTEQSDRKETAP